MNRINWQFCDDPNEINEVLLKGGDQDWEGLTDARQIINIFYFEGHRNYMVFWANEALKAKMDGDMGEVSDGYHTFNQLYHQRAVLFATIVKQNKEKAWKSWKHGDGKFCFDSNKEWFIVGVDTPEGSYTYHYEKKYWDMFDCVELERGKFWDGHTEDDVTRLLSLQSADSNANQHVGSVDIISRQDALDAFNHNLAVTGRENANEVRSYIKETMDKIKALPSEQQVTGKLNNRDGSLLTGDSEACKEQKSKLDLISRQDAINACLNGWNKGYDEILTDIRALPSADAVQIPIKLEKRYPQSRDEDITDAFMRGYLAGRSSADRPTGEWVNKDGTPSKALYSLYCSECGEWSEYRGDYCLNCGAKMERRENDGR